MGKVESIGSFDGRRGFQRLAAAPNGQIAQFRSYGAMLVERFQTMTRAKAAVELDGWIEQAQASLIASLAASVAQDVRAIRAAITEP